LTHTHPNGDEEKNDQNKAKVFVYIQRQKQERYLYKNMQKRQQLGYIESHYKPAITQPKREDQIRIEQSLLFLIILAGK